MQRKRNMMALAVLAALALAPAAQANELGLGVLQKAGDEIAWWTGHKLGDDAQAALKAIAAHGLTDCTSETKDGIHGVSHWRCFRRGKPAGGPAILRDADASFTYVTLYAKGGKVIGIELKVGSNPKLGKDFWTTVPAAQGKALGVTFACHNTSDEDFDSQACTATRGTTPIRLDFTDDGLGFMIGTMK